MSIVYSYYYISDSSVTDTLSAGLKSPVLLTFSKVQDEFKQKKHLHTHPFVEIFIFESGSGWLEIDDKKIALNAGDALVINTGKKHLQHSNEKFSLLYYCFNVSFVQNIGGNDLGLFGKNGYSVVRNASGLLPLAEACKNELEEKKPGCFAAVNAYFKLLLIELSRLLHPERFIDDFHETTLTLAGRIKIYIEEHSNEDISLDDLCQTFYINKSSLLRMFKNEYGISPIHYLNSYRIENAKKFLKEGTAITETAIKVGFNNPVYFTELFHRQTGLTPSAFKKLMKRE